MTEEDRGQLLLRSLKREGVRNGGWKGAKKMDCVRNIKTATITRCNFFDVLCEGKPGSINKDREEVHWGERRSDAYRGIGSRGATHCQK